jgi:hypothetical protein
LSSPAIEISLSELDNTFPDAVVPSFNVTVACFGAVVEEVSVWFFAHEEKIRAARTITAKAKDRFMIDVPPFSGTGIP